MADIFKKFTLKNISTPKSLMTACELKEYFDFEVKRLYFISHATGPTSAHCHFEEKEFFVVIQGSCTATIDKGQGIEDIELIGPENAIYVPNFVWHGFVDISPNAIIVALSSTNYRPDRSDYIEDYNEYLTIRDTKLGIS